MNDKSILAILEDWLKVAVVEQENGKCRTIGVDRAARSLSDYALFPHLCVISKKSMLAGKRRLRYQLYGCA